MGKIKNTKTELKAQRDSLKRFRRYLPTLLLKKQQLQMEIREVDQRTRVSNGRIRAPGAWASRLTPASGIATGCRCRSQGALALGRASS